MHARDPSEHTANRLLSLTDNFVESEQGTLIAESSPDEETSCDLRHRLTYYGGLRREWACPIVADIICI